MKHLPDHGAGLVLVVLFAGSVVAVGVAASLLGVFTAIKGAYVAIGVALATGFYYRTHLEGSSEGWKLAHRETVRRFGPRLVGLAAVWAVGIAVVTGDRALGLLVGLPVGFGSLALGAIAGVGARTLVAEAVALYGASAVSKYLTNGFYFGGGDTLYHVSNVATLVQTGSVAGIPRYKFFPGFTVLNGSIRMLGGIPAYDAILLAGIVTYGVVVLCAFVLVRAATGNERLGAFVAVGLVMIEPFLYYATYFFPQSLAVALVAFGLYVAYRVNRDRNTRVRFSLVGLALVAALILTHHLTIVLFVPLVGILFVVTAVLDRVNKRVPGDRSSLRLPRGYLAAMLGFGSLFYWAYRSVFIAELANSIRATIGLTLFTSSSGAPTPTYALGTKLPTLTVETALRSLYSTDGIYQIVLVAVFLLGVATIIDRTRTYWSTLPLFSVGIVSAVVMFRTPLTLPGLDRLQLPTAVFFAVVLGVGLYRVSRSTGRNKATLVAIVVLVAAIGTTAPLNYDAGDDLYALNSGPNLYELYPTPQPQKAYSDAEYRDLEAVAGFAERRDTSLHTFAADSQAMDGFGVNGGDAPVNRSGIVVGNGLFLYRQGFGDHRLSYAIPGNSVSVGTVIIASDWLNATIATNDRVYASGQTGLLRSSNGSVIAPNPRPAGRGAESEHNRRSKDMRPIGEGVET